MERSGNDLGRGGKKGTRLTAMEDDGDGLMSKYARRGLKEKKEGNLSFIDNYKNYLGTVNFSNKYVINRVSDEVLTAGRMIPSELSKPDKVVIFFSSWFQRNHFISAPKAKF